MVSYQQWWNLSKFVLEHANVRPFAKVIPLPFDIRSNQGSVDRQVLYRLAARLGYLRQQIDEASVEEEVDYLMKHADLFVKSDVIEDLRAALRVKTSVTDSQNRDKLRSKVNRARKMCGTLLRELKEKSGRDEKEIYLVKRFIVELLTGVHRWVAERFFFDEVESEISAPYRAFCAVLLVLIICGELTYVFLTGVGMGAEATRVWFVCLAVVVMQGKQKDCEIIVFANTTFIVDIFVLKPIFIWFTHIAMSSIVMDKVNFLISQLKKDANMTLYRSRGYLIGPSNVVQHLNPTCRATRSVPHLSLARLLISLNDFDVPKARPSGISLFGYVYEWLFWFLVIIILTLSLLPELLQEVFLESWVTVIVNMIYFAIFAGEDDVIVAFCAGTAIIFGTFFVGGLIFEAVVAIRK